MKQVDLRSRNHCGSLGKRPCHKQSKKPRAQSWRRRPKRIGRMLQELLDDSPLENPRIKTKYL